MFQANTNHRQHRMFTAVDQLPPTARKRLEGSWAQAFYDEYFYKLDEEYFDLRTIYYFRGTLCEYEREHDVNLIQKATEKVTEKHLEKFKIKSGLKRMDSTQIQSNIQNMSRIQLLVEIIHRLHRILSPEYQSFC